MVPCDIYSTAGICQATCKHGAEIDRRGRELYTELLGGSIRSLPERSVELA